MPTFSNCGLSPLRAVSEPALRAVNEPALRADLALASAAAAVVVWLDVQPEVLASAPMFRDGMASAGTKRQGFDMLRADSFTPFIAHPPSSA